MKSDDRRQQILEAATTVFGEYGYYGTTTDQVAKAAGVSQPYVVRMFGTKEKLFLEVLYRALDILLVTFRGALAQESDIPLGDRFGLAYADLLQDRGLQLSLMHGFVLGSDPKIGPEARRGFLVVYEFMRTEAGFSPEQAQEFLARGMLLNTLVGLRMTDEYESSPLAREMLECLLPEKLDVVLAVGASTRSTR
jgi:AcrR family transcriptional regulator